MAKKSKESKTRNDGLGKLGVAPSGVPSSRSRGAAYQRFEREALRISSDIQQRHLPHGSIMDPIFAAPDSNEIVGYTRAGDSAIWTGHYLAAESFRFAVTRAAEALENVKRAIQAIRSLIDVTGSDLLARASIPADSPFAEGILREEGRHGIFSGVLDGRQQHWIANTSRDQYCGVFFGLGLAFDLVDDNDVRLSVRELSGRLLRFLLKNEWFVVMPDGRISTVFIGRPDQQLALLQIARHLDPEGFTSKYRKSRALLGGLVVTPIAYEVLDDHHSYFKFNLDTISLFHLVRLEDTKRFQRRYRFAYDVLRRTTDDHGNAHFNMIDHGLKGSEPRRDGETIELLDAWLQRPRRDGFVDLRGEVEECGPDRACHAIPVPQRVRTDFLWQRSPFLLFGGGEGRIESPGIDFILPYWMARFYGVL